VLFHCRGNNRPTRGRDLDATLWRLLQIRPHQIVEIFCQFRGDLLLCTVRKMETNVVFKYFCHQAVDGSAHCGQEHQLTTTIRVRFPLPSQHMRKAFRRTTSSDIFRSGFPLTHCSLSQTCELTDGALGAKRSIHTGLVSPS